MSAESENRPNIVFINTDQQRFDTVGALGFDHMDTPNLDQLFEEGVSFTNCHITAPSCAPSRASLFTGYYPHTTGIFKNGDRWRHGWIEELHEAGYYTVNVGKMHTAPYDTNMGFDERYVVENKDRYLADVPGDEPPLPGERFWFDEWDKALMARDLVKPQREFYRQWDDYEERLGAFEWPLPEDAHPDVFVGDTAVKWLDQKPKMEPLFMEVGFPGPHPPYDPVERWAEEYVDRDLPMPDVADEDLADQPPPLQAMREHNEQVDHDSVVHRIRAPDQQRHRQRAYYYANVSMIDEKIGELVDALEANGYLDDTIVVFTSDHGDALGDHGHSQKWTMYDIITRVPTVVWAPGRFDARTVEELCQLMDLGPTMLELADVEPDESMEAESLGPALDGEDWTGREYVFAEHSRDAILQETEFMTMVRSEDWKLVHFLEANGEYGQLFDLNEDPNEMNNRWNDDDPAVEAKKDELLGVLRDWRIRSGYEAGEWAADAR